ncbi:MULTISPECIES: NACHT domain-containing protein [Brevibacillus]|uniref:NACHT domain-containing protein n=1 Tax=Brevibacillus TaxID=55080 RepID=UPI00362E96F3
MGDYNFQGLNTREFEHMIQSLIKKTLGNGSITFGDGPDGGREATFEGEGRFHSDYEVWKGYWVIQAKFKQRHNNEDIFKWLKVHFQSEMEKFKKMKQQGKKIPDNYLFFTNVVLTPVQDTGLIDKLDSFCSKYKKIIPNIIIVGYDDLCRMLDNNRDVATSFTSFISTGDILAEVFQYYKKLNEPNNDYTDILVRYLQKEFQIELYSQLRQAGDTTDDKINLEHIFVDLYATKHGVVSENQATLKFVSQCIEKGNHLHRIESELGLKERSNGYLLIGDAGYGKSTLTQFLCQAYRAYFIVNSKKGHLFKDENTFIERYCKLEINQPRCLRFPLRIILKDFAGWVNDQKKKELPTSLLTYFQHKVLVLGDGEISKVGIRSILKKISFLFVFDGLDEVPATSNRNEIINEINYFIKTELIENNCDALIVCTTRPQGYNDEFKQLSLEKLQINTLSVTECKNYLSRLINILSDNPEQSKQLTEILFKGLEDETVSKLMETPLQATIMAMLVRIGGEPPRNKFDLFSNYVETMITRERQKNVMGVINELTNHIKSIHNNLGYMLQRESEGEENPSSSINHLEFAELIKKYLLEEVGYEEEKVEVYLIDILEAIETRLAFITKTTEQSVGFSVRSLQEYFAAMHLMVHQGDEKIIESLRKIAPSAYWRKTFLFAIGYLRKERQNLIGHLNNICRELNGEGDDLESEDGKQVALLGSWLALDILVDGVFSSHPKHENMLSRLLDRLFHISPSDNHVIFSQLGSYLIDKSIVPLIKEYIISPDKVVKLNTLLIGLYTLKDTVIDELYNENWDIEDEIPYLKYMVEIGLTNTEWFKKKFVNALISNPPFSFNEELEDSDFVDGLLKSNFLDHDMRLVLIKNMFLNIIKNPYRSFELAKLFSSMIDVDVDTTALTSRSIFITTREIKIDISSGYEASSNSVFSGNKDFLLNLKSQLQCNRLEIPSLNEFIEFLLNPCVKSLISFLNSLKQEDCYFFETIKQRPSSINWLFVKMFQNKEDDNSIDKIIHLLESNYFGDTEDWRELEREIENEQCSVIEHLPYINWRTTSFKQCDFNDFYNNFYSENLSNNLNDVNTKILKHELLRAIYSYENFDGIQDELLTLLLSLEDERNDYLYTLAWTKVLGSLEPLKISELILSETTRNLPFKSDFDDFMRTRCAENVEETFVKLIQILLALQVESSFIRLLPGLVSYRFKKYNLDFGLFNFSYLHNAEFNETKNEISRVLLCLLDPRIDSVSILKLKKSINEWAKIDQRILEHIIILLEKHKVSDLIIVDLLEFVYRLINRNTVNNHKLLTRYEDLMKNWYESVKIF